MTRTLILTLLGAVAFGALAAVSYVASAAFVLLLVPLLVLAGAALVAYLGLRGGPHRGGPAGPPARSS